MKIWTKNIDEKNYLHQNHGMNANDLNVINKNRATKSFSVHWSDLPVGTKSLALVFKDDDAIPVCGFSWIHWTVANIDVSTIKELPENASIILKDQIVQGKTSWASPFLGEGKIVESGYGGCAPPDKDHTYTLTVYALDNKIEIKDGFYLNELLAKMKNHILAKTKINLNYKKLEK